MGTAVRDGTRNSLTVNTGDSSFFDFDMPSPDESPLATSLAPDIADEVTTLPGWGSDLKYQHPLSPPDTGSAAKDFPFAFPDSTSADLMAALHPASRYRSSYGQVTPPDDDDKSLFDSNITAQTKHFQQHDQSGTGTGTGTARHKPRQQSDAARSEASASSTKSTPRKNRRYAARPAKVSSLDASNPTDIRRSKFLERNRVAASKCRQKKKEWTQGLEDQARQLQKDNSTLHLMLDSLRDEVGWLKNQCEQHSACEGHNPVSSSSSKAGVYRNGEAAVRNPSSSSTDTASSSSSTREKTSRTSSSSASSVDSVLPDPSVLKIDPSIGDEQSLEQLLTSSLNQDSMVEG